MYSSWKKKTTPNKPLYSYVFCIHLIQILELRSRLSHYEKDGHNPLATSRPGQTGYSGLTSSGLTGLSSYGMSGSSLTGGAGLTGFGGGLSGGLGTGLGGLGTGLTGLGGAGLGTGLTGLSGGLSGGLGTGMTGLGSTYSPYSSSLSSPYSQLVSVSTVDPHFVGRGKDENNKKDENVQHITKQWYRNAFSGPRLENKKW